MKKCNTFVIAGGIFLAVFLLSAIQVSPASIAPLAMPAKVQDSTLPYDMPLIIRGDEEAASAASSGNGTSDDPYVIEGKNILSNTTYGDYYWDRNIMWGGSRKSWFSPGIALHDVAVSVMIRNSVVETPTADVYCLAFVVDECHDVRFENVQTLGPVAKGLFARGNYSDPWNPIVAGSVSVSDCTINGFTNGEGASFSYLDTLVLSRVTINDPYNPGLHTGTSITAVLNIQMSHVAFFDCALFMNGPPVQTCSIDTTNTVNGKPILFLNNQSGFTIGPVNDRHHRNRFEDRRCDDRGYRVHYNISPAQVIAYNCSNFEIANVVMDAGGYFVTLYGCKNGWIHDSEMTNSKYDAIYMVWCGGIIIERCKIHYNLRGGILSGGGDVARKNIIRNNEIYDNGRNVRPILSFNMEISNNEIYFTKPIIDLIMSVTPDTYLYGIQMMGSHDIDIKNNYIHDVSWAIDDEYFYGIGSGENVNIIGNKIDSGYAAILEDVSYLTTVGIMNSISSSASSAWTIANNVVTNFSMLLTIDTPDCLIRGNAFKNGAISIWGAGTAVYLNGFFNCSMSSSTEVAWNSSQFGNYWSDYKIKYPDAKRAAHFTWDTPYVISDGVIDYKPLVMFPLPFSCHVICGPCHGKC